jgi:hypothetical protein
MSKTKKVSRHSSRYVSRNKTKIQSNKNKKSIRIITVPYDEYKNDISVYLDIFKKMGFDIDFHTINHDDRININYETNTYYDINLFIDTIIPKSNNTSNKYGLVNDNSILSNPYHNLGSCRMPIIQLLDYY